MELSKSQDLLVDIGSADGYFAVGAMRANLFGSCICFERSEKGRAVLSENAKANKVADRLSILDAATPASLRSAIPSGRSGVILCDIEGAEFSVLDEDVLRHFAQMHVIIELHDFLIEDGPAQRDALVQRAEQVFTVEYLKRTAPPIYDFPELKAFDDNHRLLAFSEGRDTETDWLVLNPK